MTCNIRGTPVSSIDSTQQLNTIIETLMEKKVSFCLFEHQIPIMERTPQTTW